jgi:hypothetical protein
MSSRSRLVLALVAVVFGLAAARGVAQQPEVIEYAPVDTSGWFISAEALWLRRSNSESVFLANNTNFIVDPIGATTETLSTQSVSLPYELGPRIVLGYQVNDQTSLEVAYFGAQHWSVGKQLLGDPAGGLVLVTSPWLTIDDPVAGVDTSVDFDYRSELHDVEVSVRRRPGSERGLQGTLMGGFRYVHLHEDFDLTGVNAFGVPAAETVAIETNNNLVGCQLGGGVAWVPGPNFALELRGEAGLYANFCDQNLDRTATLGGVTATNLSGSADRVAFASSVDVGLFTTVWLTERINVKAGYEVMYLSGLALAPEQLENNIQPGLLANHVNDRGTAVFHGPSVGLEIVWGGQ